MRVRQWALAGLLALAAAWLGYLIWGLAGKARIAMRHEENARGAYEALEARRRVLSANLAELTTPRGRDAAIRTAFGVARPGEEVIVVVPPATTSATATSSWWERWFGWL